MAAGNDALRALEQAEEMLTRAGESLGRAAPELVPEVERTRQQVIDALIAQERERILKGAA